MAFDYSKLTDKIRDVFGTNAAFAEAMELSGRAVSSRLHGKVSWKQAEIEKACQILAITREELVGYFFTLKAG